ncbi:hypothetical protein FGADI_11786 [Fusarium gaditjirri]|uniref:DUF7025 domain-containing protein n=1 Tax=Fusarium gaditjirri TaxID=282569 RepID=A0A8H4WPY6_9HYPO|nr:hypothetical protein FGADI_11786 [Fusarium gaditjirri]
MSLEDYQAALPDSFGVQETAQSATKLTPQPLAKGAESTVDTSRPKPSKRTQVKGFVDIIEYHTEDVSGRNVEIIPTERFLPNKRKGTKKEQTYKDYAVVLRRTWMQHKQVSILVRIELEIQSEALCQEFRKVAINSYEDTDLQTFPIKLRSPFSELFFYRSEIKSMMEDESNSEEIRQGARVLHDFVQKNGLMASIVTDHNKYSKEGQVVGDILWTIYPPNSLVVLNLGRLQECWICRNVSIKQDDSGYYWEVIGFRIGYDGSSPGLTQRVFHLPLVGLQVCKISDLPLIPIKNYQDWPSLKNTLLARATTLQKVLGKDLSHFASQTYANLGWQMEFRSYDTHLNPMSLARQLDDRVVVDHKSFLSESDGGTDELVDFRTRLKQTKSTSKARGVVSKGNMVQKRHQRRLFSGLDTDSDLDSVDLDPNGNEDVMEYKTALDAQESGAASKPNLDDLEGLSVAVEESFNVSRVDFDLLYPALVPAFSLKKKTWLWVLSDQLRDVAWNMAAFNSLQLEKETKHLVQALVKGHKANSTAFDDVVSGKGQGLVFLLHGVADYLERPLYSISGGELSTEVTQLETKLDEVFRLTKRWDAVSLLDEADVLLCKRNAAEMDRNAIVAVFLRKIEYFQGVLFLTTNRKQDFDEAFKSRIHVTISYGDLSDEAQALIWEQLMVANKDVLRDDSLSPSAFAALGKLRFNGRTIKNILRTAVAYANGDGEKLGLRHVLAIVQTELKDVDAEPLVSTNDLESFQKGQVKAAVDELKLLNEAWVSRSAAGQ